MSLLRGLAKKTTTVRNADLAAMLNSFGYNGFTYPLGLNQSMPGSEEAIENSFQGYVDGAYKRGGVVAACMVARRQVFSQLIFQWQHMVDGRPGDLFGDGTLGVLQRPWPGGTTSDLNGRMLGHVDLAGNAFATINRQGHFRILRPDWTSILIGSRTEPADTFDPNSIDAELVGYSYAPPNTKPQILLPDEVAHFAPQPDPIATYRGMSWVTPVVRNVLAHGSATAHKQMFFQQGATPNMVIKFDATVSLEKLKEFQQVFQEEHAGVANAYKSLFLGGGADATPVGQDFKNLDYKTIQGVDETLIAANAGVPPIIAGLSEGLAASTYSNYVQAKRQFADTTIYHLGGNMAASLEVLLPVPSGARLWTDTHDLPFFRDDAKSEADVLRIKSRAIMNLINAGFTAESVILATDANDLSILEHTGLFSVQLQKPGSERSITVPGSAASALLAEGWELVLQGQETDSGI